MSDNSPKAEKSAVVLLSGGLDSMVTAALALEQGFAIHAVTIDYGQRHRRELEAARRIAKQLNVARHIELQMNMRAIGGSALTDEGRRLVPAISESIPS